jgi:hypothetical protein
LFEKSKTLRKIDFKDFGNLSLDYFQFYRVFFHHHQSSLTALIIITNNHHHRQSSTSIISNNHHHHKLFYKSFRNFFMFWILGLKFGTHLQEPIA